MHRSINSHYDSINTRHLRTDTIRVEGSMSCRESPLLQAIICDGERRKSKPTTLFDLRFSRHCSSRLYSLLGYDKNVDRGRFGRLWCLHRVLSLVIRDLHVTSVKCTALHYGFSCLLNFPSQYCRPVRPLSSPI